MQFFNSIKPRCWLLLIGVLGLIWWNWPRPDYFLANLGIQIPASAKITHHSTWSLTSEDHFLKFVLPATQEKALISQFAKQQRFQDYTQDLKLHYKAFISGHEDFFPTRLRSYRAGKFLIDHANYPYLFTYLIDKDNPNASIFYIRIWSPDN